ncbi:hypothetical protein C2S51_017730 [Perilla frutescens var. frutescens]|nr:hypothetical protein C2S51_017730 [Perilla frutescens var. frutescens]
MNFVSTDAEEDHAQDDAGGDEIEKVKEKNEENLAQSQKVLKFFDGGRDQRDEEEKMMDRLLKHYSRKNGSNKNGRSEAELKPTSQHVPMDSSSKVKNFRNNQDGPIRTSSLRVEPTSPTDTSRNILRPLRFTRTYSMAMLMCIRSFRTMMSLWLDSQRAIIVT